MAILLAAVLSPAGQPVWAAEARVTLLAPSEVKPGSSGTVELWIQSDTPVYYLDLYVSCDPKVLVFDVLTPENLGTFNITAEKREPGLVRIEGRITTLNPIAVGMLATLTFKVVGEAGTDSDISVTGDLYSAWLSFSSDGAIENVEPWQIPAVFETSRVNVATFYGLTMAVNPEGSGTTTPEVGVHDYLSGTVVEIVAEPAAGYKFSGWLGDVANPSAAVTTTVMNTTKTLVAGFVLENPPVTEEEQPQADVTPPRLLNIRTVNITRNEAEVLWTTDEIADSRIQFWAVQAQGSVVVDTNVRTSHSLLLEGLEPLTVYHYRVYSTDVVGLESVSEELSFTTLGSPAGFITGNWRMDTSTAAPGGNVIISYRVTNVGDMVGTYSATLKSNSGDVETRSIELAPGGEERLEFVYPVTAYGKYILSIGDTNLFLDVVEPENKLPLVYGTGAAAGGLLLLVAGLLVFYRRGGGAVFEEEPKRPATQPVQPAAGSAVEVTEGHPVVPASEVISKTSADELRVELGENELTITQAALSRLKEISGAPDQVPARVLRVSVSPANPRLVKMTADFYRPGDVKVEASGRTILLIGQDAAGLLDGASIGYQPSGDGQGFFLSRKP